VRFQVPLPFTVSDSRSISDAGWEFDTVRFSRHLEEDRDAAEVGQLTATNTATDFETVKVQPSSKTVPSSLRALFEDSNDAGADTALPLSFGPTLYAPPTRHVSEAAGGSDDTTISSYPAPDTPISYAQALTPKVEVEELPESQTFRSSSPKRRTPSPPRTEESGSRSDQEQPEDPDAQFSFIQPHLGMPADDLPAFSLAQPPGRVSGRVSPFRSAQVARHSAHQSTISLDNTPVNGLLGVTHSPPPVIRSRSATTLTSVLPSIPSPFLQHSSTPKSATYGTDDLNGRGGPGLKDVLKVRSSSPEA
jgi:hypothetical protein